MGHQGPKSVEPPAPALDHRDRNAQTVVRVGKELRFSDEEITAALAGMLAECDGHNYANAGLSPRVTHPTPDDLARRIEKDPARVQNMLRQSLPLADRQPDGMPYVGKDWASLGIYQQIPVGIYSWGWGTVEELMNPETAARLFYAAFRNTVQLPGEPLYYRVQKTQRSQYDGTTLPFANNYRVRLTTAGRLLNDPTYFTDGGASVIDP